MIIGRYAEASTKKLPIGYSDTGICDKDGIYHPNQPWVVVREATMAEYMAFCDSVGATNRRPLAELKTSQFYYIATD